MKIVNKLDKVDTTSKSILYLALLQKELKNVGGTNTNSYLLNSDEFNVFMSNGHSNLSKFININFTKNEKNKEIRDKILNSTKPYNCFLIIQTNPSRNNKLKNDCDKFFKEKFDAEKMKTILIKGKPKKSNEEVPCLLIYPLSFKITFTAQPNQQQNNK